MSSFDLSKKILHIISNKKDASHADKKRSKNTAFMVVSSRGLKNGVPYDILVVVPESKYDKYETLIKGDKIINNARIH